MTGRSDLWRLPMLLLALCGGVAAQRISVEAPPEGVTFGQPFELKVVRAWPRDHSPQPFDPAALLPLEVREIAASVSSSGDELVETRRVVAVAWQRESVDLGALVLRTRDSAGREHRAEHTPEPWTVHSSLPDPYGAIEWPGDVRDRPTRTLWPFVLLAFALLLLGGLAWRRTRARPAPIVDSGPTPAELARTEIAALPAPGMERAELEAYYIGLAECVRRFATRGLGVRASVHTSEELVAVVRDGADPLQDCLFRCDMVKFAANRPGATGHDEARARAIAFVDDNAGAGS